MEVNNSTLSKMFFQNKSYTLFFSLRNSLECRLRTILKKPEECRVMSLDFYRYLFPHLAHLIFLSSHFCILHYHLIMSQHHSLISSFTALQAWWGDMQGWPGDSSQCDWKLYEMANYIRGDLHQPISLGKTKCRQEVIMRQRSISECSTMSMCPY